MANPKQVRVSDSAKRGLGRIKKKVALTPDLWAFALQFGDGLYVRGVEWALKEAQERIAREKRQ